MFFLKREIEKSKSTIYSTNSKIEELQKEISKLQESLASMNSLKTELEQSKKAIAGTCISTSPSFFVNILLL